MTLSRLAPAKINLFLHILGQRSDGYHELQTVFQLLDFYDELSFTSRSDEKIILHSTCDSILPETNLVIRAAKLLQKNYASDKGVDITLKKNIPIGAGLGGGSSNAATTLMALNQLWRIGLSAEKIMEFGLSLGADVPIFLLGQSAWAEGIGEKLTPLKLEETYYLLLIPPVAVSTKEIFSHPELTRNTGPITISQFLAGQPVKNDCETLVRNQFATIAEAFDWLNQFGNARLTGTGSSVFAMVDDRETAEILAQQAPKKFQAVVARGINFLP